MIKGVDISLINYIPELMVSILITLILPVLYFFMFIGIYIVAEFIWPKKEILKS